jgi:hypothetical protein
VSDASRGGRFSTTRSHERRPHCRPGVGRERGAHCEHGSPRPGVAAPTVVAMPRPPARGSHQHRRRAPRGEVSPRIERQSRSARANPKTTVTSAGKHRAVLY